MLITLFLCQFLALLASTCGLKRSETLDPDGEYQVSWEVDETNRTVTFEVVAKTLGYVGFGISPTGGMAGADIVIGGIAGDSTTYFEDWYAEENGMPIVDKKQDWVLLEAWENDTSTYLKFSRLIATCDSQDVTMTDDAQHFIWAIGQDDNIKYHGGARGSSFVNILDPPSPEINLEELESFDAVNDVSMPPKSTSYICSIHRSPNFSSKRHTIAFRPKILSPKAKKHTHHLSFYICTAPEGKDPEDFFERFVVPGGQDCFDGGHARTLEIYKYCTHIFYSWALGAKVMNMPPGIGYPISDGGREYFMMEMHINNPEAEAGVTFQSGVEIFLSPNLRPTEAAILAIGIEANWKLMIPPGSTNFKVSTHCTSACTHFIEPEGYTLFNVQFHAHSSARKMRLRHFRHGTELPWIANDQTYDNNFQSYRDIEPVKLLPGDHLTLECWYNNTWMEPPSAVLGGYSTREEMCDAMIYYYPKGKLLACESEAIGMRLLRHLGIHKLSKKIRGRSMVEFLNQNVTWTSLRRHKIETMVTVDRQEPRCAVDGVDKDLIYDHLYKDITIYPDVDKVYEKVDECLP